MNTIEGLLFRTRFLQIANPKPVPPYLRACVVLTCVYLSNNVGRADSATICKKKSVSVTQGSTHDTPHINTVSSGFPHTPYLLHSLKLSLIWICILLIGGSINIATPLPANPMFALSNQIHPGIFGQCQGEQTTYN